MTLTEEQLNELKKYVTETYGQELVQYSAFIAPEVQEAQRGPIALIQIAGLGELEYVGQWPNGWGWLNYQYELEFYYTHLKEIKHDWQKVASP